MAYSGISNCLPQYSSGTEPALDRYIKFYAAGTTTPILGATDASGGTLVDKFRIDSDGYPVNATNDTVIPHIDQLYKIVLFLTAADADANDLNNAVWVIDDMDPVLTTSNETDLQDQIDVIDTELQRQGDQIDIHNADSLVIAKADTKYDLAGGETVNAGGRNTFNDGGGAFWNTIVGTGTANGFDIVAHDTLDLSFVLRVDKNVVSVAQYGGVSSASAFQSYLDYLSTERIEGILDQSVVLDTTINIASNTTLKAANTNFSASIVLEGGAQIQIGELGVDTFSVLLENILIWGEDSTARDVLLIGNDAFSIKVNNMRIFDVDGSTDPDKTCLRYRGGGDVRFTNLIIRGKPGAARPKYGVLVEDVTGTATGNNGITLINPDVEYCEQCYRFDGARADIYSIYLERYSDAGIYVGELATVNIYGGINIQSGGAGTPGKVFGGNLNVYSLDLFDFASAGWNLFDLQAGDHDNVNFYGIPADLIGNVSGSQGIVGLHSNTMQRSTGMVTTTYGNTKIDVADAIATTFYTIKTANSSTTVPIWYKLRVWAVSEGFGKALETYEGVITRDGGGAQLKTSPVINESSVENISGNWSIALSAAVVAGASLNEVDIDVTLDLTGSLNNGGTEDVFTTLEITTTNADAQILVI